MTLDNYTASIVMKIIIGQEGKNLWAYSCEAMHREHRASSFPCILLLTQRQAMKMNVQTDLWQIKSGVALS